VIAKLRLEALPVKLFAFPAFVVVLLDENNKGNEIIFTCGAIIK
jgi:hypothetical protein